MKHVSGLLLIFFLLTSACTRNKEPIGPPSDVPEGAYSYTSYDSTSHIVAKGWLTIVYSDSVSVAGEWHINKVGDSQDIGPQTGDGVLTGGAYDDLLWIHLNQDWIDNNVLLQGTITDKSYKGMWTWVTIAGPTSEGRFIAVKN